MKLQIDKRVENAKYYLTLGIKEFTKQDQEKMQKFGSPMVSIYPKEALYDGEWTSELPLYNFHATFEFSSSEAAEEFLIEIKERVKYSIDYLRSKKDTFSQQEVSEF